MVNGLTVGQYDAQDRLTAYTLHLHAKRGDLASKTTGAFTTTYQYDVSGTPSIGLTPRDCSNMASGNLPPLTRIHPNDTVLSGSNRISYDYWIGAKRF
jgi:hypothetical protein